MAEKKRPGLIDRMMQKLMDLGMSQRKATETAKALAPVARNTVKKEIAEKEQKASAPKETEASPTKDTPAKTVRTKKGEIAAVVRHDLPVLDWRGANQAALLQVMNGYNTTRSYIVAAVKGEDCMVAVRKFSDNSFKLKFYPTMRKWDYSQEQLSALGADSFLNRDNKYERMMFTKSQMDQVLARIEAANKSTVRKMVERLLSVSAATLVKAFDTLHSYSMPNGAAARQHAPY